MLGMELPPTLAAIAAAQSGLFTTAQAMGAGFDAREIYRRVKSRSWTRLRRGVYIESSLLPDDDAARHLVQLRAVLLCLGRPVAASHVTSAALHGLALLDPDFSLVNLTRACLGSSRTEAGVRHHDASLPAGHLTKVDDILATSAARSVVDLGRDLPFEAALVAAESALNKKLTTLAETREVLAWCVDWPGAREAGRVVSFASPHSESAGESLGRIAFDAVGLPPPSQQVWIYDDAGLIGRADYFWEEHNTVCEFDGRIKYVGTDAENALYDEKRREDRLRDAGAEVFRLSWGECRARSPLVRAKALAAFARAARSGVRPTFRFKLPPPAE